MRSDFAASSAIPLSGGETMMEGLLVTAANDAGALPTGDLAPVREALAEVANEATVDAIVDHFAGADAAVSSNGEIASNVLLEVLDAQLFLAGNGAQAPDAIDDAAAQAAAAAQA